MELWNCQYFFCEGWVQTYSWINSIELSKNMSAPVTLGLSVKDKI